MKNLVQENEQIKIVFSTNLMSILFPFIFLVHQLEEYFTAFPLWYSNLLNADLSNKDFILINGIGLLLFILARITYGLYKSNIILLVMGTLVLMNGIIHLLLSIITLSYSPGTISGIVLFIPLGLLIYKRILPEMIKRDKFIAISIGILFLFSVSVIAGNI
jgi:hypothetical protein